MLNYKLQLYIYIYIYIYIYVHIYIYVFVHMLHADCFVSYCTLLVFELVVKRFFNNVKVCTRFLSC